MSAVRLRIGMPDETAYDVRVGSGVLEQLPDDLHALGGASRVVIVSDSNVAPLYGPELRRSLTSAGFQVSDLVVPAGEASKSIETAGELYRALAQLDVGRDALVVALGGGVVGDLAGFVAATYLRGVDYVQVPTSLLAMVDSSVGGKTAIDLPEGKNLVGAFRQPRFVLADIDVLMTLPDAEWPNGISEATKSSVIAGGDFYRWMHENASGVRGHDVETISQLISRSIAFKADVVAADELERSGERECLNYGHTLGHAIEAQAGLGTFGHGVAVAEGMRFAARLAVEVFGTSVEFVQEQDALLDDLGLDSLAWGASPADLHRWMLNDKKSRGGEVRFVLPHAPGDWETVAIPPATIDAHLVAWARSKGVEVDAR